MADYTDWINELSKRSGAPVEQSDIDRLNSMDQPDDISRLQGALTSQYQLRGSNTPGQGPDSTERTAAGYGSGRTENADDQFNPQVSSGGNGGGGGGGSTTSQSWVGGASSGGNANPASSMFPDWYRTMMERQMSQNDAARAENKARADALFGQLSQRAGQTLAIDRNDPIIRAQQDAFAANTERSRRNYLSDTAESAGPYANLQGERRMAAERTGIANANNEAGLLGSELSARRNEIQNAYGQIAGMLSGDQVRQLQEQMGGIDAAQRQAGLGVQYDLGLKGNDLGLRNLGLQDWDRQMYWDMLQRGMM